MVPGPWSGEVVSSKSSPAPRFYIFILVFLDQWFDRRGGRILILFILQLAPTALKSGSIFSSEFPQRCVVLHYNLRRPAEYFGNLFLVITILQEVMICLVAYLLAQHQNFNLSLACQGMYEVLNPESCSPGSIQVEFSGVGRPHGAVSSTSVDNPATNCPSITSSSGDYHFFLLIKNDFWFCVCVLLLFGFPLWNLPSRRSLHHPLHLRQRLPGRRWDASPFWKCFLPRISLTFSS